MIPIFIDYLFSSDITVWVQCDLKSDYKYHIFYNNKIVNMVYERRNFTFTRDLSSWTESTTLKYLDKSVAEIQIHKNRTFKFRFIMNALADMLEFQNRTNETFGITAEKAICDFFNLDVPSEYLGRYDRNLEDHIMSTIAHAFCRLPKAIKNTGTEKGVRGKNSKCSYDFLLEGNKTLSLKTNTGKMICPPEVGQPGADTCFYYFKDFIDDDKMTNDIFKNMILNRIDDIMPIYVHHLFDSDYLLWIYERKTEYFYKIYDSDFAKSIVWKKELFSFTKATIEEWNESNTVKYNGIPIGEFQVHKHRSCYKFRFNMENFEKLINTNSF